MLIKNYVNNFQFFFWRLNIQKFLFSTDNSTNVYITKNSLPNPKLRQTWTLASAEASIKLKLQYIPTSYVVQ